MNQDLSDYAPEDLLWKYYDDNGNPMCWSAYAIRKRTERFVYVSRRPIGVRRDDGAVRLARAELEAVGSIYSPQHDDFLYTTAAKEAKEAEDRRRRDEWRQADAIADLRTDRRVFELGSQLDFAEVYPGVYKAGEFEVYAHNGKYETCARCQGSGKEGRRTCGCCHGRGLALGIANFAAESGLTTERPMIDYAFDLDELREMIAADEVGRDGPAVVFVLKIGDLRNREWREGSVS
jgi:hypothetical protein